MNAHTSTSATTATATTAQIRAALAAAAQEGNGALLGALPWGPHGAYRVTRSSGWPHGIPSGSLLRNGRLVARWTYTSDEEVYGLLLPTPEEAEAEYRRRLAARREAAVAYEAARRQLAAALRSWGVTTPRSFGEYTYLPGQAGGVWAWCAARRHTVSAEGALALAWGDPGEARREAEASHWEQRCSQVR